MASAGNSKEAVSLFLTPMLDIFSILIVFLLMSFSTDPVQYDGNPNLELPQSWTMVSLDEIPTVVVTKNELFVNDKKISSLFDGDIPEKDRMQGAIYPLYTELVKLKETNDRLREARKGAEADGKTKPGTLTMEMDKDHRFQLAKRIMLSGQQAEFVTFKLMAAKAAP